MALPEHIELEAKVAVDDHTPIITLLQTSGGEKIGLYEEHDVFFDFEDQRLKNSNSALRLRRRVSIDGSHSFHRLTFKGPRQKSTFKQRMEIEFGVDDSEKTRMLLECLGMKVFMDYTKLRESWRMAECTVELDELEGIGKFVEVEGPCEEAIRGVLKVLGLSDKSVILESYLSMVIRHAKGT
jgi:adenylate cyclase class 2